MEFSPNRPTNDAEEVIAQVVHKDWPISRSKLEHEPHCHHTRTEHANVVTKWNQRSLQQSQRINNLISAQSRIEIETNSQRLASSRVKTTQFCRVW